MKNWLPTVPSPAFAIDRCPRGWLWCRSAGSRPARCSQDRPGRCSSGCHWSTNRPSVVKPEAVEVGVALVVGRSSTARSYDAVRVDLDVDRPWLVNRSLMEVLRGRQAAASPAAVHSCVLVVGVGAFAQSVLVLGDGGLLPEVLADVDRVVQLRDGCVVAAARVTTTVMTAGSATRSRPATTARIWLRRPPLASPSRRCCWRSRLRPGSSRSRACCYSSTFVSSHRVRRAPLQRTRVRPRDGTRSSSRGGR